jgi:hypothetical protein
MFGLFGRKAVISFNGRYSGLGNRIRVVLGAKMLALSEDRDFYYVWPTGRTFGPKLSDLWRFDDPSIPSVVSRTLALKYPYLDESLNWLNESRRGARVWQIRTGHALHLPPGTRSWHEEFRSLRPVSEIETRVEQCYSSELADRPYVGVMIRAHSASHAKTIEHSPVEWYLDRMRAIRKDIPDVQFFVSCDVPEVQRKVSAEIGGCHGLTDKGVYNTVEGVRAAVADLYLLGSSSYLLGPHYSSFVELARYLAGADLILETSMKPVSGKIDLTVLGQVVDPIQPHVRVSASGDETPRSD